MTMGDISLTTEDQIRAHQRALRTPGLSHNQRLHLLKEILTLGAGRYQHLLMGTGVDPRRFVQLASKALYDVPQLVECDHNSFFDAVRDCAQFGWELGGALAEATIVPFGSEATLIPGYRGLIRLAWQGGHLRSYDVEVVYE